MSAEEVNSCGKVFTMLRALHDRARGAVSNARLLVAVGMAIALLGYPSTARADEPARSESTVYRLWIQPPIAGATLAFDASDPMGVMPHFGAASIALEFSQLVTVEAGGGALFSLVGGEPTVSVGADAWARGGVVPVVYRSRPEGGGWVVQLASTLGYRFMQRGKVVYEDYGVDVENIHALALDLGAMATYWTAKGTGFAVRLLSGAIVPIARAHARSGYVDHPFGHLSVAVPLGLDIGMAF